VGRLQPARLILRRTGCPRQIDRLRLTASD
jgi:hypothetical protein